MRLSPVMTAHLSWMRRNGGISYAEQHDATLQALARRGLVAYHRAHRYGKSCWMLTDEGQRRAGDGQKTQE